MIPLEILFILLQKYTHAFLMLLSISLIHFLVQGLSRGLAIAFHLQQTVWFRSAAAYYCYISGEMKCL